MSPGVTRDTRHDRQRLAGRCMRKVCTSGLINKSPVCHIPHLTLIIHIHMTQRCVLEEPELYKEKTSRAKKIIIYVYTSSSHCFTSVKETCKQFWEPSYLSSCQVYISGANYTKKTYTDVSREFGGQVQNLERKW